MATLFQEVTQEATQRNNVSADGQPQLQGCLSVNSREQTAAPTASGQGKGVLSSVIFRCINQTKEANYFHEQWQNKKEM